MVQEICGAFTSAGFSQPPQTPETRMGTDQPEQRNKERWMMERDRVDGEKDERKEEGFIIIF